MDGYVRSLAVLIVLESCPVVPDQHGHICFHWHAECPAWRAAVGKHGSSGHLCAKKVVTPQAMSDGHTVPGALHQQLGAVAHLLPQAWHGAQADFGEGVVHNSQPGWSEQGKGRNWHVHTIDAPSPQPPVLWLVAKPPSRGHSAPGEQGSLPPGTSF